VSEGGISELMQALYRGETERVSELRGAHLELDVFEAAALGDVPQLRTLLDADPALVGAWSADGFTPLHFAAFFGHPDAASLLIERGADLEVPARNEEIAGAARPLHSATAAGRREVCAVLLEAGADVNARQHAGYTPLLEAAQLGDSRLVELLLEHGADRTATLDDGQGVDDLGKLDL
jgi:ankyrin repeat protein